MSNRLLLWCFKGLLAGPDRDEYYEILGVSRKAETSEIRRAYRAKCLEVHPDKLRQRGIEITDDHRHLYQTIQKAGEVLSDPGKRELYDQLGETGMKIIEEPSNVSPEKIVNNFLNMRNKERSKLVLFVILFVGAILLFPILLCAKVDEDISTSWTVIWIPLWIYDAMILYYFGYMVSIGRLKPPEGLEENWVDPFPLKNRIFNLILCFIFIAQQIFIAFRLDDIISWLWVHVLLPLLFYYMFDAFSTIIIAIQKVPIIDEVDIEEADNEHHLAKLARKEMILKARAHLHFSVAVIAQLMMIVTKADEVVDWDWRIVFWPLYIYFVFNFLILMTQCSMSRKILSEVPEDHDHLSPPDAEKAELGKQLYWNAVSGYIFTIVLLIFALLAVSKISGATFSTFIIFIPLFIASCCLVCCMSCFICCARGNIDDLDLNEDSQTIPSGAQMHTHSEYGTYGGGHVTSEEPYIPPPAQSTYIPPEIRSNEPNVPRDSAPVTRIDSDID